MFVIFKRHGIIESSEVQVYPETKHNQAKYMFFEQLCCLYLLLRFSEFA